MTVTEVVPVSIPGLLAVRSTAEELRVGMKEHHVVARIEQGRSEWWAHGKIWRSEPGSIELKQPGEVYRDIAIDASITFQGVLLPATDIERVSDEGKVVEYPHLAGGDARSHPFHHLHDAVLNGADRLSLEVALTEAVGAFVVIKGASPDHTRPVRRVMEYFREHLGDTITLNTLALDAGLDKFHLCRAFRRQIGLPPHAYLTYLRISRAKQLLRRGVRASEVAAQVGLYDQSQLNRHFRRIVGTTPARYGRLWSK